MATVLDSRGGRVPQGGVFGARSSRRRLLCSALLAACSLGLAHAAAPPDNSLPAPVLHALQQAGVPPDALAAVALPLLPGQRPWRHRAQVPMQPGSTMKLVTSIVALDRLTPNLRGSTELLSAAPLDNGVLLGDLVLKGGADPELGLPQLWALLVDLRQRGVSTITGDLVLDRTLFRPARMDLGLPPFDEAPEFPYNVIPDALQLAGNLLTIELQPRPDGTLQAATVPPLAGLDIGTGQLQPTETPCKNWDNDWKPALVTHADGRTRIELQGGFPRLCTQRAQLQLIDRVELAERLFRTLWQGLGGLWAGHARDGAAAPDARLLARRVARPWGEVLRNLNKQSDNVQARLLYLQLGVAGMAADPQASTAELAARAVRGWLAEHRISDAGLVLDNGSGLSRSERIAPLQLAQMLKVAFDGQHAADLLMSLPVAGVDGSLRNRLKDSPATGWARLKTGTLANVTALAGVLRDNRGRPWAVAMMINHPQAAAARPALDALVDSFARVGPHGVGAVHLAGAAAARH